MSKLIIFTSLFIIGGLAILFYAGMENPPVSLTLLSPNETYKIRLDEKADRFLFPIHFTSRRFPSEVRFNVSRKGQLIAENEILWSDTSDNRLDVYKYHWITDSILKYGEDNLAPESEMDEITISNDTNQKVDYLILTAVQHYLIFDLQPQTSIKLSTLPQPWLSWISSKGKFNSGKTIRLNGVNFPNHQTQKSYLPQHYCISIRDYGILIQNQEIEGYKTLNGVDVAVPKCGINPSSNVLF